MNTAQDHAKAAWRSGGSVPAIEAGILAYNQELIGRLDTKDALLAQGSEKIDGLQAENASLRDQIDDLNEVIRRMKKANYTRW